MCSLIGGTYEDLEDEKEEDAEDLEDELDTLLDDDDE